MYACIYKKRFPFHTRTSQKATKLNKYLDSSLSLHTFATLFINMKYLHFIIILIIFLVANKIYTGQVLETNTQPEQTVCIYQQEDTATHKQQDCRFLSSASTHIYKEARIDFNTSFHAFRTQWLQNQQRFVIVKKIAASFCIVCKLQSYHLANLFSSLLLYKTG